jgi:hypothetical protein
MIWDILNLENCCDDPGPEAFDEKVSQGKVFWLFSRVACQYLLLVGPRIYHRRQQPVLAPRHNIPW